MNSLTKSLAQARVHIAGVGRVGSAVALALHEAGVGVISCNDPQLFEQEQLEVSAYSRCSDLGKPKVHVLERFLDGRSGLVFLPVVARNQSPQLKLYFERADLIVSCANRLDARIFAEGVAVRRGIPCVQACVQDARTARGGVVFVRMPSWKGACFACLFPEVHERTGLGEVLLPNVTRLVASLAANVVVSILTGQFDSHQNNLFAIDAYAHRVEGFSIKPRLSCHTCGGSLRHRGRA